MPKRLGIFSFYDSDGILEDATLATLVDLRTCLTYLVVVINGSLQACYREQVSHIADQIVVRPNQGFDAGAYKDVLFHHLTREFLAQYDEFVLCNDTFYGPFVPFRQIFSEMELRKCDFWGLQYTNSSFVDFLPSYFLCYRAGPFFSVVLPYFADHIRENTTNIQAVYSFFERGTFCRLCEAGYTFSSYAHPNNLVIYRCNNVFLREYHLPILKKKCFSPDHFCQSNVYDALQYIAKTYPYDISLILRSIKRRYQLSISLEQILQASTSQPVIVSREVGLTATKASFLSFLANCHNLYLYGSGEWSYILYAVYLEKTKLLKGVLCSDQAHLPSSPTIFGVPVYALDSFAGDDSCDILVALGAKNTQQVRPLLDRYPHVFYLY